MYKVGRVVYFISNGDFKASSSSVLPTGITTYISSISDDLTPITGEYECSRWNNTGYVFLQVVKEIVHMKKEKDLQNKSIALAAPSLDKLVH